MAIKPIILGAALAAGAIAAAQGADKVSPPLTLDVFNPGEAAIFPVASVLVSGERDAVLIDAQFSRAEAQRLVERVRASGKRLTTVYVSHGDPDFYFGLDVVKAAFPEAKIVASPATLAAMRAKAPAKVAYWGPILKDNAPREIVYPQAMEGDTLMLEGRTLQVRGPAARSYVWIESIKTVAGGVVLFNDLHVWMADTQTPASRADWLKTLDGIEALKPVTVVPGHFKVGTPLTPASIVYTRDYVQRFEKATEAAADSAALIAAMEKQYPAAGLASALQTSAKVAKGEMKW